MTFAIHQPNFIPWLGYFSKLTAVDSMIFFDSVAISNGKTWTSRSQILVNGEPHWLTLPIKRSGRGGQRICDVELLNFSYNWHKTLRTIRLAYSRAKYFDVIFPYLESFQQVNYSLLADFNCAFIQNTCQKLDINTEFLRSSSKKELMESAELKTDYIVQTCQSFDIKNYVSGKGGSLLFLEKEKFTDADIQLRFHNFTPTPYNQLNTEQFTSGLSIVDVLMNCGWENTTNMLNIKSAIKPLSIQSLLTQV
jgi:WbqC-like protein family